MAWGRLDDQANGNPKLLALSDAAWRMWGCALIYCQSQLTDGFVPTPAIHTFGVQARDKEKVADELCATQVRGYAPLWARVEGGYQLHDYLQWNDSRQAVLAKRHRDRKRKGFHDDSARNPHGTGADSEWTRGGITVDSDRPTSTPVPHKRTSTGALRRHPPRPVEISHPSSLNATPGTFGLYCTLAREARQQSTDVDQSDQIGNIAEWMKTLCARRSIQYDGEIVTKAIEAVMQADAREAVGPMRRQR
jgi:hypothetical protein